MKSPMEPPLPTAMTPRLPIDGYLFVEIQKSGDRLGFAMPAGPYTAEGGVFSIVVSNTTDEPVIVAVRDVSLIQPVPVHFIQPAIWGPNSPFVQIGPGSAFTFVLSGGLPGERQTCSFTLVVGPAPTERSLQTMAGQIDPWHG